MVELREISEYINRLSVDFKAEAFLSLFEGRVDFSKILASYEGQLKRAWSRDISKAEILSLYSGPELLNIKLNRDGIYDCMPEAIFHDLAGNDCSTGSDMAKESMRVKAQEKEGRLFFQPIENEIFRQGLLLSAEENRLFELINAHKLLGLIPDFFEIEADLHPAYVAKMIRLIPQAHLIAGNATLTAQCLEFVIEEKVGISSSWPEFFDLKTDDRERVGVVGSLTLGFDSVVGDVINGPVKFIHVKIGPIENPKSIELILDGSMDKFLNTFYGFFMPVEVDLKTQFVFKEEDACFILANENETEKSYLGLNSVI